MKKYISGLLVLVSGVIFSQSILNAKSPEEFRQLRNDNMKIVGDSVVVNDVEPLEYGYVNDKDILKAVYVWEVIDLNDKINQPYYYNMSNGFSPSSKSLYKILLDGAMNGDISEVYDDENFLRRLETTEIEKRLSSIRTDDALIDIYNSGRTPTQEEIDMYTDHIKTTSDKVRMIKVMGMWFIDKRDGQMKYRPLGIAAMGPDPNTVGRVDAMGRPIDGGNDLIDLFWIFYPDARKVLANNMVYNPKNSASDLSFDDLLNARRFSSIIYRSTFGSGDGTVKEYVPKDADGQIEESNRIKEKIIEMENQMWNY